MRQNSKRIVIIGAGSVGRQLALALHRNDVSIEAVISRTKKSARDLARSVGCTSAGQSLALAKDADVVLICVPDPLLKGLAVSLRQIPFTNRTVTLIHTSGIESHHVLRAAKANRHAKIRTASMHPMQSFPQRRFGLEKDLVSGIFFGIEGDVTAVRQIIRIIRRIHAFYVRVPTREKAVYHAGAVIVSNFLVALLAESVHLYRRLGLSEKQAMTVLTPLIRQSLDHARVLGPKLALTGPAARGDEVSIQRHVAVLQRLEKAMVPVYKELTKLCMNLVRKRNGAGQ